MVGYDRNKIAFYYNDKEYEILKSPYDGRIACPGMGDAVDIHNQTMPF